MSRAPVLLASSSLLLAAAWYFARQSTNETVSGAVDTISSVADSIATGVSDVIAKLTRGERNNNPGNIRQGNDWQGEVQGTDTAFETFGTPEAGVRALAKLLKKYHSQGFNSVRKIITRYAPSSENNTAAYIAAVAASVGVSADRVLVLDRATLTALVTAIIKHENGRVIYTQAQIDTGVSMA